MSKYDLTNRFAEVAQGIAACTCQNASRDRRSSISGPIRADHSTDGYHMRQY